jgi:hypothetical protein
MKVSRHRWTVFAVAVWVLALALTTVLAPVPTEAKVDSWDVGWMVYTPNHPNGCAPLPYDCYVVWVWPS